MISHVAHLLFLALTQGTLSPIGSVLSPASVLDLGYRQMYNLQFQEAHKTFWSWEQMHPYDPMGPTSDAAAYLFAEFDRLGVLQKQLFFGDEKFQQKGKRKQRG